ncbi:uncharacterized protein LOC125662390 [Ostrea edulis]|uniref:uncharacterized protein LOC125662390 n=1 Tax=Ostrea edulis TaxID=37623 RepID=UPI0024AF57B7|nr:uncharacterized protein LOC125662390 [Ostrea edulis]
MLFRVVYGLIFLAASIQLSLQPNRKCKCKVGILKEVLVIPRNKCEFVEFTKNLTCQCDCSDGEEQTYLHYVPSSTANKTYIMCEYKQLVFGECLEYNEGGEKMQSNNELCTEHACSPCKSTYKSTESYLYPQCFKFGGLLTEKEKAAKDDCTGSKETHLYALLPITLILGFFIGHYWKDWKTKCVSFFNKRSEYRLCPSDESIKSRSVYLPFNESNTQTSVEVPLNESNTLTSVDLPPDESNTMTSVDLPLNESNTQTSVDLPPDESNTLTSVDLPPDESKKSRIDGVPPDETNMSSIADSQLTTSDMTLVQKYDLNDMDEDTSFIITIDKL